jgi:CSLREA domain-containing protein
VRSACVLVIAWIVALWVVAAGAATFTVDSTLDATDDVPGDGVCSAAGACTLRAAVQESNALAGPDAIVLPAGTFTLTIAGGPEANAATGDLDILGSLNITGAGSAATVIDAGGVGRVLEVRPPSSQHVALTDLTLRGGDARAENETLASGDPCLSGGGAICVVSANGMTMNRVTVESNVARFGGGLFNQAGVNLTECVVRANQAVGGGDFAFAAGGGLITSSGNVSFFHSTIEGNVVDGTGAALAGGGGAWVLGSGQLTISDSTVTNNQAPEGIAIHAAAATLCPPGMGCQALSTGPVRLVSATIVEAAQASAATLRSDGTIISTTIVGRSAPACTGTLQSQGYNLFETPSPGCTVAGTLTGNLLGVDPLLGPLGAHGGFTPTRALLYGSPAIDASASCLSNDQRGVLRPVGPQCDIGAVEGLCGNGVVDPTETCDDSNLTDGDGCESMCQIPVAYTFTVDSTADLPDDVPGDGLCSAGGDCTLRAAVQESNALVGPDTIILPAGTYVLAVAGGDENLAATGDLDVTGELEIVGDGAGVTVIDGGGIARVFEVRTAHAFGASDLTIQHGSGMAEATSAFGSADGGGLLSVAGAPLTLTRVRILENTATNGGGLRMVFSGALTLTDSVVADNVSDGASSGTTIGGGLAIAGSGALITGSAIFGNRIVPGSSYFFGGGGFWNSGPGTVTVRNSTFSDNDSDAIHAVPETLCFMATCITLDAGPVVLESVTIVENGPYGVAIASDRTTLRNTILAGTMHACSGPITSAGHNLIQTPTTGPYTCPITGDPTGNLLGVDPMLTPLGDHGGPTPTHAPLVASPAIEAGNPAAPGSGGDACPTIDQRGLDRPAGARCDMGAVEGACGNGVQEAGEQCDDSNAVDDDGCNASCNAVTCGDGDLDPGETCDDGNVAAGDCCSPTCTFEASGTPCADEGDDCTLDQCDAVGTCTHPPSADTCCTFAQATCVESVRSSLAVKAPPVGTRMLKWTATLDTATTAGDFGDPVTTSGYDLCLYEDAGSVVKLRAAVPAGGTCDGAPCWRATAKGFRFRAGSVAPDGVKAVLLVGGTAGHAKIKVIGRGAALPVGDLPVVPTVRMRLVRPDASRCWGAELPTLRRNDGTVLQGRLP